MAQASGFAQEVRTTLAIRQSLVAQMSAESGVAGDWRMLQAEKLIFSAEPGSQRFRQQRQIFWVGVGNPH